MMRGHRPVETDFRLIDLSALSAETRARSWLPPPTPQSIVLDHRAVWRMRRLQSRAAWNRCLPISHGRARCPATSVGGRPGSFMPGASLAGRLPVSVAHLSERPFRRQMLVWCRQRVEVPAHEPRTEVGQTHAVCVASGAPLSSVSFIHSARRAPHACRLGKSKRRRATLGE
jgi:hypothetical protein